MREGDRQENAYGNQAGTQEQALSGFLRPDIDELGVNRSDSHGS